ncbi:MAG: hypothetical protein FH759_04740 [Sediminimonas qiaohouensis]|uniref:Uncharacterized protein n=1 Tax=Sediminimonas qiaohouensis TaxID=552061 RepID=A0A7C9HA50_9RHOB|nr:hypothetical protein [Sediminimonas qiaohouensis]MTJ03991.1 hypothetical protein [Sediminimonas qiaohouensis]
MWALVVTVCLSGGDTAECRTWTSQPMPDRDQCSAMMAEIAGPVDSVEPLHVGARCVFGEYA